MVPSASNSRAGFCSGISRNCSRVKRVVTVMSALTIVTRFVVELMFYTLVHGPAAVSALSAARGRAGRVTPAVGGGGQVRRHHAWAEYQSRARARAEALAGRQPARGCR